MSSNLNAALIAAGVALSIEYAAKPRLEARKDRILETLRTRRELLALLMSIATAAHILIPDLPAEATHAVRDSLREEQARAKGRLTDLSRQFMDDAGKYAAVCLGPYRQIIIDVAGIILGVHISERPGAERARIIVELCKATAGAVDPPRLWQVWAWTAPYKWLKRAQVLVANPDRVITGQG